MKKAVLWQSTKFKTVKDIWTITICHKIQQNSIISITNQNHVPKPVINFSNILIFSSKNCIKDNLKPIAKIFQAFDLRDFLTLFYSDHNSDIRKISIFLPSILFNGSGIVILSTKRLRQILKYWNKLLKKPCYLVFNTWQNFYKKWIGMRNNMYYNNIYKRYYNRYIC